MEKKPFDILLRRIIRLTQRVSFGNSASFTMERFILAILDIADESLILVRAVEPCKEMVARMLPANVDANTVKKNLTEFTGAAMDLSQAHRLYADWIIYRAMRAADTAKMKTVTAQMLLECVLEEPSYAITHFLQGGSYADLVACYDEKQAEFLDCMLRRINEEQQSPEDIYAEAVTFLNMRGGQFDPDHAIKLLTQAAKKGSAAAAEDLIQMYRYGSYAEEDPVQELRWLTSRAKQVASIFDYSNSEEDGLLYCRYLYEMMMACFAGGKLCDAKDVCEKWYQTASKLNRDVLTVHTFLNLVGSELKMGDICFLQEEWEKAQGFYEKVEKQCEAIAWEMQSVPIGLALSVAYYKLGSVLLEIDRRDGRYGAGHEYQEKAKRLRDGFSAMISKPYDRRFLYESYEWTAMVPLRSNWEEASYYWSYDRKWFELAVSEACDCLKGSKDVTALRSLAHKSLRLGYVFSQLPEGHSDSCYYSEEAAKLFHCVYALSEDPGDMLLEARCWNQIGQKWMVVGLCHQASDYFEKAHQLVTTLGDRRSIERSLKTLVGCYHSVYRNGISCARFELADEYFQKAFDAERKYFPSRKLEPARLLYISDYNYAGDEQVRDQNYETAEAIYRRGIKLVRMYLAEENAPVKRLRDQLIVLYSKLGNLYKQQGEDAKAQEYYDAANALENGTT